MGRTFAGLKAVHVFRWPRQRRHRLCWWSPWITCPSVKMRYAWCQDPIRVGSPLQSLCTSEVKSPTPHHISRSLLPIRFRRGESIGICTPFLTGD
ncbi:hypothetical protein BHM03_00011292 [Ensete ventricosum]|nr:hypothetical protein BHM03_00011292 [Ensete ventricosum]